MVKENKEEKILECAIKIFSEKGYSAATTSEIAKEAGVAEGTIFRYFKTKKDILRKVMIKLIEIFGERLITLRIGNIFKQYKGRNEKEIFKAIIKDRMELMDEHSELIKVILTEIQYHEDLRNAFYENIIFRAKEVINEFIEEGIKNGVFRDVNPTIATRTIVGMFGIFIMQNNFAPKFIEMEADKQIDAMIDLLFYGMAKNKEE